ncbi:hypothetical protein EDD15DRAFT_2361678 [Pisolithus albus]|nr:hypothetical protein EDD15DRAFT_2361678 [Pisolithus albus]
MAKDDYSLQVPTLNADGSNWLYYKARVEWAVGSKGLSGHLTSLEAKPEDLTHRKDPSWKPTTAEQKLISEYPEKLKQWTKDDGYVKQVIAASLPESLFLQVQKEETGKSVWDVLTNLFQNRSRVVAIDLRRKLQHLQIPVFGTVPTLGKAPGPQPHSVSQESQTYIGTATQLGTGPWRPAAAYSAALAQPPSRDLTARSVPPPGSREAMHATYEDYFVEHWTRKNREAYVLTDCPLIEVHSLPRHAIRTRTAPVGSIIPQGACRQTHFSEGVYRAFLFLPRLCRRATDVYRAREARFQLGLPPIADDLLIESTALPTTNANWNLETLGDSVLKLITTSSIAQEPSLTLGKKLLERPKKLFER